MPFKYSTGEVERKIKSEIRDLPSKYFKQNASYALLLERLMFELRTMPNVQRDIWSISNNVSLECILYCITIIILFKKKKKR